VDRTAKRDWQNFVDNFDIDDADNAIIWMQRYPANRITLARYQCLKSCFLSLIRVEEYRAVRSCSTVDQSLPDLYRGDLFVGIYYEFLHSTGPERNNINTEMIP
jgi:hypothetical protein